MKNSRLKEILIPTVSLFVICLCVTALLAVTNAVTKDAIAYQQELSAAESRQAVCPDAVDFEKVEYDVQGVECYKALDESGNLIGYAISSASRGYGGDVKVMTGINAEDGSVIAINVYDNSGETPGLGVNTSGEKFTSQFAGLSSGTGVTVDKDAGKNPDSVAVDSVTGATISSRAVTNAVNQAFEAYNAVKEG
ncbi:MAG TPA: RnfABCDGE type electron transport complex subunit G [Candidatus Limousia pullorum]|uniref:Ion-translocating oxidoreductase complex subunit G n=1 Tax=Candidatus Limousia pullorum TaxID=2840860 RepID=A0A9D1LX75_9FIRM|nr:RnfABCDGE type electron transport complex subunit G [Candidatus Limousia pullorum]